MSSDACNADFSDDMPSDAGGFVTTTILTEHTLAAELKHPLAAILLSAAACSRWLAAQPPNLGRAQRALERIANEGRRAGEIIEGLRAREGDLPLVECARTQVRQA
jgi:hypothetical protein